MRCSLWKYKVPPLAPFFVVPMNLPISLFPQKNLVCITVYRKLNLTKSEIDLLQRFFSILVNCTFWLGNIWVTNSTMSSSSFKLHVAIVTPTASPRVLHQPVILAWLTSITFKIISFKSSFAHWSDIFKRQIKTTQ